MKRREFIKRGALFVPMICIPRLLRAQTPITASGLAAFVPAAAAGGGGGSGPYTLQFHAAKGAGTTDAANSTGATLIVVALTYYSDPGLTALSDNKGNTWTALTMYDNPGPGTYRVQFFYCANPTVGSGHTWTTTGNFPVINVLGFAGVGSPVQDGSETGDHATQPGSITPSTSADVFICALTDADGTSGMAAGYTSPDGMVTNTLGGQIGYKIKTNSTAENPTISPAGSLSAVTLVAFK